MFYLAFSNLIVCKEKDLSFLYEFERRTICHAVVSIIVTFLPVSYYFGRCGCIKKCVWRLCTSKFLLAKVLELLPLLHMNYVCLWYILLFMFLIFYYSLCFLWSYNYYIRALGPLSVFSYVQTYHSWLHYTCGTATVIIRTMKLIIKKFGQIFVEFEINIKKNCIHILYLQHRKLVWSNNLVGGFNFSSWIKISVSSTITFLIMNFGGLQIDRCRNTCHSCRDTRIWIPGICSNLHHMLDFYGNDYFTNLVVSINYPPEMDSWIGELCDLKFWLNWIW